MSTLQLTLEEKTHRKLKAYFILTGMEPGEVEREISEAVDGIITEKLSKELGLSAVETYHIPHMQTQPYNQVTSTTRFTDEEDEFAVGEGLSYESIEDEDEEEQAPHMAPAKAATREELQKDDLVEDPNTEAVGYGGEEDLDSLMGINTSLGDIEEGEEEVPGELFPKELPDLRNEAPPKRSNPRKLPKSCKAKITGHEG